MKFSYCSNKLTNDLRAGFGKRSAYSVQNLCCMRTFYREYKDYSNLQPLAGEIAGTKNILVLDRCQRLAGGILE